MEWLFRFDGHIPNVSTVSITEDVFQTSETRDKMRKRGHIFIHRNKAIHIESISEKNNKGYTLHTTQHQTSHPYCFCSLYFLSSAVVPLVSAVFIDSIDDTLLIAAGPSVDPWPPLIPAMASTSCDDPLALWCFPFHFSITNRLENCQIELSAST